MRDIKFKIGVRDIKFKRGVDKDHKSFDRKHVKRWESICGRVILFRIISRERMPQARWGNTHRTDVSWSFRVDGELHHAPFHMTTLRDVKELACCLAQNATGREAQ